MSSAIIMFKPDAFEKGCVEAITAKIPEHGLTVRCRHRRLVEESMLPLLFPDCAGDHVLERAFNWAQYADQMVEVVLVTGENACERALGLRARARDRWSTGPFANVVHCADSGAEWAAQLRVLAGDCATCREAWSEVGERYEGRRMNLVLPPGIRGDEAALRSVVRRLWDDKTSPVWRHESGPVHATGRPQDADAEAILIDDNPRATMDSIAAGIMAALPECDAGFAIAAVCGAAHVDEYALAVGGEAEMAGVAGALRDRGLAARTRPRSCTGYPE